MNKRLEDGFLIGDLQIYPLEGRINTPQGDVHVRPKVMAVLLRLAKSIGRVVTRETIIESVWGHSYGADEALSRCISSLRHSLGDSTKNPKFLETIPKRGYRLIGTLEFPVDYADSPAATEAENNSNSKRNIAGAIRSLAILPFVNVSNDPDKEYFSDGMSDELIGQLSKQPGLRVAARTSSFSFKGKNLDVRKIGQQLDVEAIMEGSVRTEGDNLRILVQLIDSRRGYNIWSENYSRKLEDVFEIQKNIAECVIASLNLEIDYSHKRILKKASTKNLEAYDYYLKAREYYWRDLTKYNKFARKMFSTAIKIDPNFARAWAGLSNCATKWYLYCEQNESDKELAQKASLRAVELAPDLSEAHLSRGLLLVIKEDYEEALIEFEQAIQLDPNSFEAHMLYGKYCLDFIGDYDKAAIILEEASRIRPEFYSSFHLLSGVYKLQGKMLQAQDASKRMLVAADKYLDLHPDDSLAYAQGAFAWLHVGNRNKASEWAEYALSIGPDVHDVRYHVARLYARMGKNDEALKCLEQCEHLCKEELEVQLDLKPLHRYKRFQYLLKIAGSKSPMVLLSKTPALKINNGKWTEVRDINSA